MDRHNKEPSSETERTNIEIFADKILANRAPSSMVIFFDEYACENLGELDCRLPAYLFNDGEVSLARFFGGKKSKLGVRNRESTWPFSSWARAGYPVFWIELTNKRLLCRQMNDSDTGMRYTNIPLSQVEWMGIFQTDVRFYVNRKDTRGAMTQEFFPLSGLMLAEQKEKFISRLESLKKVYPNSFGFPIVQ